jgi:hypothetical protein
MQCTVKYRYIVVIGCSNNLHCRTVSIFKPEAVNAHEIFVPTNYAKQRQKSVVLTKTLNEREPASL